MTTLIRFIMLFAFMLVLSYILPILKKKAVEIYRKIKYREKEKK